MPEVIVREYLPEDRAQIEKCIFELQEDEFARRPHFWSNPEEVRGVYMDSVLKSIDSNNSKIFVGLIEGTVVAWMVVRAITEDAQSPNIALKSYGYIPELAVLREYKGRGVGKALMNKAEEFIKSKGLEWIELDVSEGNGALDFYSKSGYKPKSIRMEKKLDL
ncbi:MAG: GNAT family N-acetyltransferase [Candidatus Zambryskibacteria bacterium]|nr:GNAT family N-acetyltransferase [Candidatus Zambryskibacteria bacterium]